MAEFILEKDDPSRRNFGQALGFDLEGVGWGGYPHIFAIWVCAAVKGMVFKQFSLGYDIEIREFWSNIVS